jgi:hypothetical protein
VLLVLFVLLSVVAVFAVLCFSLVLGPGRVRVRGVVPSLVGGEGWGAPPSRIPKELKSGSAGAVRHPLALPFKPFT